MKRNEWLEYIVTEADEGMTVEAIARQRLAVSGRMLQRLTRSKGVQLNRKAAFLGKKVAIGDRVSVRIADRKEADSRSLQSSGNPASGPLTGQRGSTPADATDIRPAEARANRFRLDVLYEDDYFIIVNKPAGVAVHPVQRDQRGTLVEALSVYWTGKSEGAVPHPVHRLDKETSGAILIAKSSYAHQLADRELREGNLDREYLAIVEGCIEDDAGTIAAAIARDPLHKVRRRVSPGGEQAITHYRVIARSGQTTLVRIRLETGRTHQIRVHFAHLRHPLAGDTLYGGRRYSFARQALHAIRLSFVHPLGKQEIVAHAPLPDEFCRYIEANYREDETADLRVFLPPGQV